MTNDGPDPGCLAAAIVDDGAGAADRLLIDVAARLRGAGWRVRGLLSVQFDAAPGCPSAMVLADLATGDEYLVSQPLGSGSLACRADPQGFARASQVFRRALDEAPDLVISNRFGGLEATGGGFSAELLELLSRGVPVLTAVAPRFVEAWRAFTGSAPELPADLAAVEAWLAGCAPARLRAGGNR